MSSIIVLDSSDEDESTSKRANLEAAQYNSMSQRILPSGVTISAHQNSGQNILKFPLSLGGQLHEEDGMTKRPPFQRKRKMSAHQQATHRLVAKSFAGMSTGSVMSPAAAATTIAPKPPIMPLITGAHSLDVSSAAPPLNLMATPPHSLNSFASLSEHISLNHNMRPANLPEDTTIIAQSNVNASQNNNYKKMLAQRSPLTPAPLAPSAQMFSAPLAAESIKDKAMKRVKPTTILKSTDDAWLQQRPKLFSSQSEESYHRAQATTSYTGHSWDISGSSPNTSRPTSQPHSPGSTPSTPKSRESPDVEVVVSKSSAVFDLTESPEKTPSPTTIITLDDSICKASEKGESAPTTSPSRTEEKSPPSGKGTPTNCISNKKLDPIKSPPKPPLEPEFEDLVKVCRRVDKSEDMQKIVKNKLIKYYYRAHEEFVTSESFRKRIRKVVDAVRAEPDLVYYNLKTVMEELKVRRKAKFIQPASVCNNGAVPAASESEAPSSGNTKEAANPTSETPSPAVTKSSKSTGNKKLDRQIQKLDTALLDVTKRIEVLEQSEVDWEEENSSYLQVERLKKRACQIYEKICELTGESKSARKLVNKPIKFNMTRIPQFNKTLQAFINRTREFPDYYDVLRMLEHCNRKYNLGLVNFEIKNIAEDAFLNVGKLLQSRRKTDLYDTVLHYGGRDGDPAQNDPELAAKLKENQKNRKNISEILEKYARKQDMPHEEDDVEGEDDEEEDEEEEDKAEPAKATSGSTSNSNAANQKTTANSSAKAESGEKSSSPKRKKNNSISKRRIEDSDDDDDYEEDEDEEDSKFTKYVEELAQASMSDNDSEEGAKAPSEPPDPHIKQNGGANTSLTDVSAKVPEVENFATLCDTPQVVSRASVAEMNVRRIVNINLESPETKTACSDESVIIDCETNPPNGKHKDTSHCFAGGNAGYTSRATGSATSTTTTTADLKIVSIRSYGGQDMAAVSRAECSAMMSAQAATKSLDEIIISDEES